MTVTKTTVITKRMLQLGGQIRDYIATMLVRGEISDPRAKGVTIHSVKMTRDLQMAKVYFTSSHDPKETEKGLKTAAGFIRRGLGKHLQIRYIPQLMFYYDDSLEHSLKMTSLISKVSAELREAEIAHESELESEPQKNSSDEASR
jgi:ribosome-binding factor A